MNYQSIIGVQMALIHELNRLRQCGIWESCLLLVVLIDVCLAMNVHVLRMSRTLCNFETDKKEHKSTIYNIYNFRKIKI